MTDKGWTLQIKVIDFTRFATLFDPQSIKDLWKEVASAHGAKVDTDGMQQQFDCHVEGGIVGGSANNPTWDLEFYRDSNPLWQWRAAEAVVTMDPGFVCNW